MKYTYIYRLNIFLYFTYLFKYFFHENKSQNVSSIFEYKINFLIVFLSFSRTCTHEK